MAGNANRHLNLSNIIPSEWLLEKSLGYEHVIGIIKSSEIDQTLNDVCMFVYVYKLGRSIRKFTQDWS